LFYLPVNALLGYILDLVSNIFLAEYQCILLANTNLTLKLVQTYKKTGKLKHDIFSIYTVHFYYSVTHENCVQLSVC